MYLMSNYTNLWPAAEIRSHGTNWKAHLLDKDVATSVHHTRSHRCNIGHLLRAPQSLSNGISLEYNENHDILEQTFGQTRSRSENSSTSSPHIHASPPATRAFCSGVRFSFAKLLTGSKAYHSFHVVIHCL